MLNLQYTENTSYIDPSVQVAVRVRTVIDLKTIPTLAKLVQPVSTGYHRAPFVNSYVFVSGTDEKQEQTLEGGPHFNASYQSTLDKIQMRGWKR
ncbi:hypothetical protein E1B28_013145 [Marasmius oreades]|uniref:Uncharacterized protein n=1 Tax=Marasmius oreades TaxID=181124 RepID=A0A9P7RPA6_9AGAR|nr:uncharacterized protein E1B28_013145 [Marasmius oreades]KAG7087165.1 hypothetical protein E1B28_013145 [Marasmius oreades]